MQQDVMERLKSSRQYRDLVKRRGRLSWMLTAVMLVVYYGYVLLIAFDKEVLAARVGSGVMTWGMPIGLFVIVFTVLITGLYVRHANSVYDDLTDKIKQEVA
ncbi:DUF485 domain-containing protein [Cupriavidus plantarum]|uniref:DUF485 domain-containing protein n=1 Tax=Cupriavidus plantarum TaxID=942865 RepID=UPI000E26C1E8|nr:DUF485 domain-containing protein [Cupriavidus plantarum]REF02219.1 uncharacterized membrane protein (DUF485 family) [Cupriavidus plantarum]RLK44925.1 uncharacterized membrane protein (DUF485 family) [Cupriavidus plantarum]